MLTLYHAPQSRSSRIIWLLEELGVDYEIKIVSIRRRDPSAQGPEAQGPAAQGPEAGMIGARDPANLHPHGKVPALVHDGATVVESAAIVLYLTDAFPQTGIGPGIGDPRRGAYLSWLAYYTGVMEPAFTTAFYGFETTNSATGWVSVAEVMGHVNGTLAKGPYLLGDAFSGADVLAGSAFALFMGSPLVPRSDLLAAYVERLTSRPAYQRAAAKDGAPAGAS
ncbi:MAG: glutathione S-transferase family protein [Kiloniellales bacterium]